MGRSLACRAVGQWCVVFVQSQQHALSLLVEELCGKVFTSETIRILFDLHKTDPTTVPDLRFFFEEASGGGGEYVKFMPVASTQIAVGGAHKVAFDIRDSLRDGWTDAG